MQLCDFKDWIVRILIYCLSSDDGRQTLPATLSQLDDRVFTEDIGTVDSIVLRTERHQSTDALFKDDWALRMLLNAR